MEEMIDLIANGADAWFEADYDAIRREEADRDETILAKLSPTLGYHIRKVEEGVVFEFGDLTNPTVYHVRIEKVS